MKEDWEVRIYEDDQVYMIMMTRDDERKRFTQEEAEELAEDSRTLYCNDNIVAVPIRYV